MSTRDRESGYTLVVIAALLVVFLGFTALSVDVGVLYSARASAQRAADAAALAGAFVFITRPDLDETTTPKQSDVIKAQAVATAATNKMLGATVTIATSDVTVDTPNRRVTVNVTQSQPTLFARILGENSANIHGTAIAEAAKNATGDTCVKPWFIPNTVLSTQSGADAICHACGATPAQVLIDTTVGSPDYLKPSQFYRTWLTSNPSRQFTIKPQNPGGNLSPGQFFAIRLGDSQGGNDYQENIITCPATTIYCQTAYPAEPGDKVGPTSQGTCTLICYNYDGTGNCNSCARDTWEGVGAYRRPAAPTSDGGLGTTSRSLAIAPIIDVCTFCPNLPSCSTCNYPNGTDPAQYTVIGFATIFLEGFQGSNLQARLINVTDCSGGGGAGGGGGGISPSETGSFSLPIRLVRLP
jgi:Flp pilus assembly protein TadG